MNTRLIVSCASFLLFLPAFGAEPGPALKFNAVQIDDKVEIGYGVTVADVDGDGKPDILLADKKQFVWYKNPSWQKFVLAENLTKQDNVCIAARDINGDGKAEIAVGGEWNPSDTTNSGAVFYLVPGPDRTQKWEAVELHHEPTVHRMRWVRNDSGKYDLVVAPLHGKPGAGSRILQYEMPADPHQTWGTKVISDSLHMTHNLDPRKLGKGSGESLFLASKEGIFELTQRDGKWRSIAIAENGSTEGFSGAGEVREGKLKSGSFIATVEPMHGTQLAVYLAPSVDAASSHWNRHVLDDTLKEGHALACGDLNGKGEDQIVVGWRNKNAEGKVGIKIFTAADKQGKDWNSQLLDDNGMACEDLCLADLNGDGKLDVVASGRATKNLKIYFNENSK
jgi:hypothetical protein